MTAKSDRPSLRRPVLVAAGAFLGLGLGFELAWLLGRSAFIDMRFDTSVAVRGGLAAGLASALALVLSRRRVTAGAKAGIGFLAVFGAVPVVPAVLERYGAETLGIVLLDGLRLRAAVPVALASFLAPALVAAVAATGAVWYARWRLGVRRDASGRREGAPASHARALPLAAAAVAAVAAYWALPPVRVWVDTAVGILARGEVEVVRDYLLGFGPLAPAVSALLMVLQSVAAPLPAFVVTFSNGLLFGWVWGALLSWSSAMAGAALCFWIARAAGRPVVERLAGGAKGLDAADLFFERYGDRAVLVARLLPFVSFDIVSYAAGLTPMGFRRFLVATGVGQLPATLVYSYLGQNLTGSVRVLFVVFVVAAALFVAASAARPVFMRRLEARRVAPERG